MLSRTLKLIVLVVGAIVQTYSYEITLDEIDTQKSLICCQLTSRFGDNMMAYIWSKWHAYQQDLPFCLRPFEYSNQLALHSGNT